MSQVQIEKILNDENLTAEMKALAIQRLFSKLEEVSGPTAIEVDAQGRYILKSVLTSVKTEMRGGVKRLVVCESTDPAACGRFALVYGHGFQQRNKQLVLSPLSEFKYRERPLAAGQRGELKTKNLDWAMGDWALIGESHFGGTGPSIPLTYYGHIGNGESVLSGRPSYNAKVDPSLATVEEPLRLMVEGLIASLWGHHGEKEVFGDADTAIEVAKATARVGKFGLTLDRETATGPRFLSKGQVVDAKVVQAAAQPRRNQTMEGTSSSAGENGMAAVAAAARARVAAARAAQG